MSIAFDQKYYRLKNKAGNKFYVPLVYFNGVQRTLKRGLKRPFRKAQDACDYGAAVANRYVRMFG